MNIVCRLLMPFFILCSASLAVKAECNIGDLFFGPVSIEILPHPKPNYYETGIIIGDDTNGGPFKYRKILGQIEESERDGSRAVYNAAYDFCGILKEDGRFDAIDAECASCKIPEFTIRKSKSGMTVVSKEGRVIGTIKGRLSM